jgi:purine-binding chemotaxis protein CheW
MTDQGERGTPLPGARASLASRRASAPEHHAELRRRAADLARVPVAGDEAGTSAVRFRLGGQDYAVDAACILQVGVLRELAPLPGAQAPLFGITHWRGSVLTVLDLRGRLGARAGGLTDLGRILVVDGRGAFGVLADAVIDMIRVPASGLQPLPSSGAGGAAGGADDSLLKGMTDDGVLVIDADALRSVFDAVRAAAPTQGRGG